MSRRPQKVLRWAWNPADGGSLEPPASDAAAGWSRGVKPAAQHLNALLNNSGAWADFLRGPSLNRWSRVTTGQTLLTANLPVMAADRVSTGVAVRRRLVVAGTDGTGLCVLVSRRGDSWARRDNFPGGLTGHFTRVYCFATGWYACVDDTATGAIISTSLDGETGSALDGTGTWDDITTAYLSPPSGVDGGAIALASQGNNELLLAWRKKLYFREAGAGSWGEVGFSGGGGYPDSGGAGTRGAWSDVIWDGAQYVAISTWGDVVGGANPLALLATRERITLGTGLPWRLSVGASGELVAWVPVSSAQPFYRSTDHGASWERLDAADPGPLGLTSLTYDGGVWVATSTAAPYVWSSNDLISWTPAVLPYVEADAQSIYGGVLSEGAWVLARTTTVLVGGRAEDLADGEWSTDPKPTALSNAGWITGRRIAATAPTSGQVLTWSAGTSQWVPADASGSSSPTTTAGDLIYRGASVDQRLAIGTSGQVLWVSGGAPAWHTLTPANIGAVPTSLTLAGLDLTANRSASDIRTALSTDTTSGTRTPTDASVTLAKLGSDVTVGKLGVIEHAACGYAATDSSSDVTVGGFRFDPADYAISGKTTVLSVTVWGRVASGSLTGTVTVYDVTTGTPSSVGTASITSTTGALSTISITLPGSAKAYEIRIKVSGGSVATDIVTITGAARRITWS